MPQKTWVVGEETLAADFNLFVQQQVVARFASVAARDAAWPAATAGAGAVCITYDTATVWVVNSAIVWVPLSTPPTPWVEVTVLTGSWVNFGNGYQITRYRKIGDQVYLEGLIAVGVLGQACMTLPVGFRPVQSQQWAEVSNGLFGNMTINPDGTVLPVNGSNANFQINCNFSTL